MSREAIISALNEARAYSGTVMFEAMKQLLEAIEDQYRNDLVTTEPDKFQRIQAAAQQVRALRRALTDREGDLSATI